MSRDDDDEGKRIGLGAMRGVGFMKSEESSLLVFGEHTHTSSSSFLAATFCMNRGYISAGIGGAQ